MSTISYLRVSTAHQSVSNQRQAIKEAKWKIDREFVDEAVSGSSGADSRAGWAACSAYLRDGDTLICYSIDRLGRSTLDVISQIQSLNTRGIRLVILLQAFDTATPAGMLALTMFAAFSEFETEIRKSRQLEGITRARAEGKYAGRKPKLNLVQQADLSRRYQAGENRSALAREFDIDRATVFRYGKAKAICAR